MKYIATSNLCQEIILPTGRNKYEEEIWQLHMRLNVIKSELEHSKPVLRWMDYEAKVVRSERETIAINKQIDDIKHEFPEYFL